MDFKEIKELIKIFDESGLSTLTINKDSEKIKLQKGVAPKVTTLMTPTLPQETPSVSIPQTSPVATAPICKEIQGETINSPMVGTFYRCPSPDVPAYVNVGDKVKKGQTLAIIEAMKIMNEIEAEFDCVIKEIIPSDAQPVEYNSPLFVVEKI